MIVPIIMIFYPSLPDWVFIFVPLALLTLTLILKKWGGKIIIDEKAITKRFLFWNEWSLPLDEIVELCPGRIELGRRFSRVGGFIIKTQDNIYRIGHDINNPELFTNLLASKIKNASFIDGKYVFPHKNLQIEYSKKYWKLQLAVGLILFIIVVAFLSYVRSQ